MIEAHSSAQEKESRIEQLKYAVLAYHLYNQTLANKLDPWMERTDRIGVRTLTCRYRNEIMAEFANHWMNSDKYQAFLRYHLNYSARLEPIAYNYSLVNPYAPTFSFDVDVYRFFSPPESVVEKIGEVNLCIRSDTFSKPASKHQEAMKIPLPGYIQLSQFSEFNILSLQPSAAENSLFCFEGQTGHDPHSISSPINLDDRLLGAWSIMGYALFDVRQEKLNFAFRGSQSGSAERGFVKGRAFASGNPDWITDTQQARLIQCPTISPVGLVSAGFAVALMSCLPAITRILYEIVVARRQSIKEIHITGHSLGGALAALLKTTFGSYDYLMYLKSEVIGDLNYKLNVDALRSARLTTFSAPMVGDKKFVDYLQERCSKSQLTASRVTDEADPITKFAWGQSRLQQTQDVYHIRDSVKKLGVFDTHHPAYLFLKLNHPNHITNKDDITRSVLDQTSYSSQNPWQQYDSLIGLMREKGYQCIADIIRQQVDLYYICDIGNAFITVFERMSHLLSTVANIFGESESTKMIKETREFLNMLKKEAPNLNEPKQDLTEKCMEYIENTLKSLKKEPDAKHLLLFHTFYAAAIAIAYADNPSRVAEKLLFRGLNANLYPFAQPTSQIWS